MTKTIVLSRAAEDLAVVDAVVDYCGAHGVSISRPRRGRGDRIEFEARGPNLAVLHLDALVGRR